MPYPPGGPIDSLAAPDRAGGGGRPKQSVVVENRPGASGIIGTGAVARAEPDGYTLILGTNQTHATNQSLIKSWTFDAVKDFAPVAGVAAMPHVLVVRKDFPADSLADVVAMAKAKPGSADVRLDRHRLGRCIWRRELFKTKAGIDMLHVPYKGLAPMTTELLAGRVDLSIAPLPGPDRAADRIRQRPRAGHRERASARRSLRRADVRGRRASPASKPTPGRRCLRRPRRRPR